MSGLKPNPRFFVLILINTYDVIEKFETLMGAISWQNLLIDMLGL